MKKNQTFKIETQVDAKVINGVIYYRPPFSEVWLQAHGNILTQIADQVDPNAKTGLAKWMRSVPK